MTLPIILPALALIAINGPAPAGPAVGAVAPSAMLFRADQTSPASADSDQTTPPVIVAAPPVQPTTDTTAEPQADVSAIAVTAIPATGPHHHAPGDPLEGFNRAMFSIHQKLDKAAFRPAAMGYRHVVPRPVRSGLRNFFSNLGEPIVALNFLLQLKFGKAAETIGRFAINSTIGIAGFVDVAKGHEFKLPHRSNGFGNTLGFYGVKPGPYLFLPLVGPTNLRDFLGGEADGFVLPVTVGKPFDQWEYQMPRAVITGLDQREQADDDLRALMDGAVDPYATLRSAYLQGRQGEIDHLRGKDRRDQLPGLEDSLDDPAGPAAAPVPGGGAAPELSDPLTDPAAKSPVVSTPRAPSDAGPDTSDPLTDPAAPAPPVPAKP